MERFNNYIKGILSPKAEEEFVEQLIEAKNDRAQRKAWTEALARDYNVERDRPPSSSGNNRPFIYLLLVAAALGLAALFLWSNGKQSAPSFDEQVDMQIAGLTIMGDQSMLRKSMDQVDSLRKAANLAYVNHDYEDSNSLWQRLTQLPKAIASDYFYLGICQLKKADADPVASIAALQRSAIDTTYQQERAWLLALAHCKAGQREVARPILQSIVSNKAYQATAAKDLLERLTE